MTIKTFEMKYIRPEVKGLQGYYATPGSAGIDLCLCSPGRKVRIAPGRQATLLNTGIAIHIKDRGLCGVIVPRSGLGHRGLVLGNGTGIIDADYQGEIKISVVNRGVSDIELHHGDRIAQILFMPIVQAKFNIVEEFEVSTSRGHGGFGSTGK